MVDLANPEQTVSALADSTDRDLITELVNKVFEQVGEFNYGQPANQR